jgi:hypothetical protein
MGRGLLVSEYHVYCDESGNRPTTDDGELFVTSAVFYSANPQKRNLVPISENKHNRLSRTNTVMWLALSEAYASGTQIRPFNGYKVALDRQMRIMRYCLKRERQLGKARRWPLAPEDVQTTNFIWLFSMSIMVINAMARIAYIVERPATQLRIFLDQKTMSRKLRDYFEGNVRHDMVPSMIHGYLNPSGFTTGQALERGRRTAERLASLKVSLEWSDDRDFSGDHGLLSLADGLSHYVQRELRPYNSEPGFLAELAAGGRENVEIEDITRRLLRADYANWEERMGEKVPPEIIKGSGDGS